MLESHHVEIVKNSSFYFLVVNHPEIVYILKKNNLIPQYPNLKPRRLPLKIWSPELIDRYRSLCKDPQEFKKLFYIAYKVSKKQSLPLKEIKNKAPLKIKSLRYSPSEIAHIAKKYDNRDHFASDAKGAYSAALTLKILDQVCQHMEVPKDSIGEQLTRKAFQFHFKHPFIKVKPKWLINPKTKSRLELDGFSKHLNIAFEVNGVHHFRKKFTKHSDVKFKDLTKQQLCEQHGIKLYSIKYESLPQLINLLNSEFRIPKKWLTKALENILKENKS